MSLYKLLRLPGVLDVRGCSKSKHYLDVRNGLWTHPVPIGDRAQGWLETETNTLNAARIAGKTPDEIRKLVKQLEAARKDALKEVHHACK